ncbi:hypothetical protein ASG57_29265 [Bradyrhizobium sp. Leaf396]|nr:hypothetical protein ASG57_29265 [Bradyrhizobium sp. Leaf396]
MAAEVCSQKFAFENREALLCMGLFSESFVFDPRSVHRLSEKIMREQRPKRAMAIYDDIAAL